MFISEQLRDRVRHQMEIQIKWVGGIIKVAVLYILDYTGFEPQHAFDACGNSLIFLNLKPLFGGQQRLGHNKYNENSVITGHNSRENSLDLGG